jgi:hypothetical protein
MTGLLDTTFVTSTLTIDDPFATFGGMVAGMADVAPFLVAVHDFMPSRAAVFSNVFLDFHGMMKLAA